MTISRFDGMIIGSVVLLLGGCATLAERDKADAERLAGQFCETLVSRNRIQSAELMTAALRGLLRHADEAAGDKPPLSSIPGKVASCKVTEASAGSATIELGASIARESRFSDRLLFERRVDGQLQLADVRFGPDFRQPLSDRLRRAASR